MRVAIDARPAVDPRKTGVGYYAQHLIRGLPRADPETSYTAWYLHAKGVLRRRRFFGDVAEPNFSEKALPLPARVFRPVASRLAVPRLEWFVHFDALLATNFLPPPTRSEGVVLMVHDLAFRVFPGTAPRVDDRWRRRFERWLADAARVIVPSESARRDLVAFEGVPGERVEVIPHGVDAEAFAARPDGAAESARDRFGIDGPYLLFVGGIEPRKNLVALVRAFARVPPGASLLIAGGPVRWIPGEAGRLRAAVAELPADVRRRVVLAGYVSDAEKAGLMAGATALVYPSLYEGFGFPVLEGMAAGLPVLTSNVSSLPEVAGDAALLVDPHDEEAIAGGMQLLLADGALRDRLGELGRARAAEFTWDRAARRTAEVLRAAAAGAPG